MIRFTIVLDERIFTALAQLADREHRPVRDEAAHLITSALEQRGLLKAERPSDQTEAFVSAQVGAELDSIIASAPYPSIARSGGAQA